MRGMASAKESRPCPPNGRYPFNITAAEAGQTQVKNEGQATQKGGDTCVKLSLEIAEGEYAGYPAFDTLGTDGGTTFGGMSKKKWRQLEVPYIDSDQEVPDDVIAQSLLNRRVFAEVEREQQNTKDEATGKLVPQFDIDEKTGVKVPRYRLRIVGYVRQPVAGQQAGAPQGLPQGAPVGQPQYAPPPQQLGAPGLPAGFPTAPPQQGGFPGAPVAGGYPGAPGGYAAPPGMPAAMPGVAPGFPGAPQGFPQVAPPQGWTQAPNGVQGAPQGAPQQPGQLPLPGAPGR